ncbi:Drought induced 19 protein-like [Macleaya cordata]|uniref:Drought induced 19 protein-like n=1 Tax=Macleaya cordata TaxID=56857 RepID=A0A200QAB4_MACCD|nr:Drought induced 19 protein-like [Macleaya cordata]
MDADSWSDSLSTSKRYQSRNDLYLAFEEIESDDDPRAEYSCPFCSEDFDIIGLCCHIDDEHPIEAENGDFVFQVKHIDEDGMPFLWDVGWDGHGCTHYYGAWTIL